MPLLWWTSENLKDIPPWAYSHLVVKLGAAHEILSDLRCFEHRDLVNGVLTTLIRIVHPEEVRRAGVHDFTSLDRHPELIRWEGWLDQDTGEVYLEEKPKGNPVRHQSLRTTQ